LDDELHEDQVRQEAAAEGLAHGHSPGAKSLNGPSNNGLDFVSADLAPTWRAIASHQSVVALDVVGVASERSLLLSVAEGERGLRLDLFVHQVADHQDAIAAAR